ncbi:MAG: precorrin-2 dehydrogenase/sirohydrochlorin ferrochelatase family protein [Candidatus Bathyarchaeia archaeon]
MLIDFRLDGKTIVIIGGGREGCRKILNLVDSNAQITVVSSDFSDGIKSFAEQGKIRLHRAQIKEPQDFVSLLDPKPDLLLAVTNDTALNAQLLKAGKAVGCLVYSVDAPELSDFTFPAVARIGDVKIAVSTGGKSPAMARELRQRIVKYVTPEDLLAIDLQSYLRKLLKISVDDHHVRSQILNEMLNNVDIKQALRDGNLDAAKELALKLLKNKGIIKT